MKRLIPAILLIAFCSLRLPAQNNPTNKVSLHFANVSASKAVETYAQLSQRTVLYGCLPQASVTVNGTGMTQEEALSAFENAFKKEHLACIPDGKKFVLLVRDSEVARAKALLAANPCPKEEAPKSDDKSQLRPGTIDFINTPVDIVFQIYGSLANGKGFEPNPAFPLPPVQISLRSQTSLARGEAIHALDIVFGLNGIKAERTPENKINPTPLSLK